MSNKIETVSIGDLPIATELDDADELLLRDASAALPENATARLSIATLRAAMGGGSPDRIESASGEAFVEASEFNGSPRTIARSGVGQGYAIQATFSDGDKSSSEMIVKGDGSPPAGIRAEFDEGVYTLSAHGAPLEIEEPTEGQHAATKGYVDARPGADAWSEHAATEDVDLDGHKLTGLGEPTDAADAATKGYVDGAAPAKIERTFAWGRSVAEVTDDGNIELAVYLTGQANPLRRVRVPLGSGTSDIILTNRAGMGANAWNSTLRLGASPTPAFEFALGPPGYADSGGFRFSHGRLYLRQGTDPEFELGTIAKQAYDRLPALEWWDPVWTPVENVDSVANVECQYTRVHRAAGGSLVTLEGTITVTPEALSADSLIFSCPLPVPQVGSAEPLGWAGDTENRPGSMCAISGGSLMVVIESTSDAVRTASFRISYRAA